MAVASPIPVTGVPPVRTYANVEAFPAWPSRFAPQQRTCPLLISAHECESPSASAVAPETPTTVTGEVELASWASPFPSWPELFWPQHRTVPSSRMAHAWSEPTPTFRAVLKPDTVAGALV